MAQVPECPSHPPALRPRDFDYPPAPKFPLHKTPYSDFTQIPTGRSVLGGGVEKHGVYTFRPKRGAGANYYLLGFSSLNVAMASLMVPVSISMASMWLVKSGGAMGAGTGSGTGSALLPAMASSVENL